MPTTLAQFTEGDPSDTGPTDYVIGYDAPPNEGGSGKERKWKISTLATSLSSILQPSLVGSITSLSGTEIVAFTEKKATPSISGNTLTLNLSEASLFYVNLNSVITTFTLTNVPSSPKVLSFTLQFVFPDNTARTVAWPTGTRWSGGSGPTPTCQTNKVDTFTFVTHDGGSNWFAFVSDQNH